jgi:hypothetical protein
LKGLNPLGGITVVPTIGRERVDLQFIEFAQLLAPHWFGSFNFCPSNFQLNESG